MASSKPLSSQTLKRLPLYLDFLKSISDANISATGIAEAMRLGDVLVRKDLASISTSGKPKTGYIRAELIEQIENVLGYNDMDNAILIGAGSLGMALLNYEGFSGYGLNILYAFDVSEKLIDNRKIFHTSRLTELCGRSHIHIGIITVSAEAAQGVCDTLIENGINAIWNFAPVHLNVPHGVLVQNENMAASLALLSRHLREQREQIAIPCYDGN